MAEVVWAGIVAPGLYQFNVRIPNLPAGDHLVEAFVQGYPLQDQAYITVQP